MSHFLLLQIVNLICALEFLARKCLAASPSTYIVMSSRTRRFSRKPSPPLYPTLPTFTESPPPSGFVPPSTSYGVPDQSVPLPEYGAPQTPAPVIHKHIYVHVREFFCKESECNLEKSKKVKFSCSSSRARISSSHPTSSTSASTKALQNHLH